MFLGPIKQILTVLQKDYSYQMTQISIPAVFFYPWKSPKLVVSCQMIVQTFSSDILILFRHVFIGTDFCILELELLNAYHEKYRKYRKCHVIYVAVSQLKIKKISGKMWLCL